jgi:C-terminal processing protease CtpA/Prc
VVFNLILAFGVLTAQVHNVGYNEVTFQQGVRVPVVQKDGAAARYGLLPGDVILEVDGVKVKPGALSCFDAFHASSLTGLHVV